MATKRIISWSRARVITPRVEQYKIYRGTGLTAALTQIATVQVNFERIPDYDFLHPNTFIDETADPLLTYRYRVDGFTDDGRTLTGNIVVSEAGTAPVILNPGPPTLTGELVAVGAPSVVTPVLESGEWGTWFGTQSSPVTGNVLTIPFPRGALVDVNDAPVIIGIFRMDFFPLGSESPSTIVATYGGIPCTTRYISTDLSLGNGDYGTLLVMCVPSPSDVFVGSNFVVTFNGTSAYYDYQNGMGAICIGCDPVNDFNGFVSSNFPVDRGPGPPLWSQGTAAVSAIAGDLMAATIGTQEAAAGAWIVTSSPSFVVDNSQYPPNGAGHRMAMARRELIGPEADAVIWGNDNPGFNDGNAHVTCGAFRVTATAVDYNIDLDWTTGTQGTYPIVSWRLYRSIDGAAFSLLTASGVQLSTDSLVTHGANYRYYVTAVDSQGNESTASNIFEADVP